MHSQVLLRDLRRDGHSVEYLHEQVIDLQVVSLIDLLPECKRLSHVPRLVIAPQHDNAFRLV